MSLFLAASRRDRPRRVSAPTLETRAVEKNVDDRVRSRNPVGEKPQTIRLRSREKLRRKRAIFGIARFSRVTNRDVPLDALLTRTMHVAFWNPRVFVPNSGVNSARLFREFHDYDAYDPWS